MIQDAWGWCTGMTQRDGTGREVGGGFRMGNMCTPVADSCWCMATESEGPCPEDLGLPTPGLFWLIHPDLTQLLVGIIKFPTLFPPCFWFLFLKCTHFLDDLTQPGLCGPLRLPASSAQTFGCLASPCAQFSARWSIWVLLQHSGLNMSPWSWFSFKWAPSWGSPLRVEDCWNSLAVQWLELHASTVGDPGSIPGQQEE